MPLFKNAFSPWDQWWDWAAAWCSVKVIMLSLGVFSILAACWMLSKALYRECLAKVFRLLSAAPGAGFLLDFYYLVKALL